VRGFEIAEVLVEQEELWLWLRRQSDQALLPVVFPPEELYEERSAKAGVLDNRESTTHA
jgi:hypothetical protein